MSFLNYRLVLFTGGMFVAKLYMKRLMLPPVWALLLLGVAIGCVGKWHHDSYFVHMVVWAPAALVGTYALLTFESFVSKHMPRFLQLLGDASYSIYLSHLVVAFAFLHAVFSTFPRLHVLINNSGYICLKLIVACGVGVLIHKLIEQPILRRFSVWIGGHPALPAG